MITQIFKKNKLIIGALFIFLYSLMVIGTGQAAEGSVLFDSEFADYDLQDKYSDIKLDALRFLDKQRSPVTGLIESYKGSSLYYFIPSDGTFEPGHEPYLANQAFTHDLATAIMIYTTCGEKKKAKQILDNLRKDFYRSKNGKKGLYASYKSDQFAEGGALIIGVDGDRIHVGPNMWVALAAIQYIKITRDVNYLPWVIDLAKWVSKRPHFTFKDGQKGGVATGSGWGPDWSKDYSTRNCIDFYSILLILQNMYNQSSDKAKQVFIERGFTDKEISRELASMERWLKEIAYNQDTGGFNAGYNENGINSAKTLDTVFSSLFAIGPERLTQWGINPFRLIEFAEQYLLVKDEVKKESVEGFDFTIPQEINNPRTRLIWIEGTAQMVLAYKIMAKYSAGVGDTKKAGEFKKKAIRISKELDKIADLVNLPNQALPYTSDNPGDKERIITYQYEWELPRGPDGKWVGSIASTVWRFFSLTSYNPIMTAK